MRLLLIVGLLVSSLTAQVFPFLRRNIATGGGGGISFVAAQQTNNAGGVCAVTLTMTAGDTLRIGVGVSSGTQSNLTTPASSGLETISIIGSKQTLQFDAASTMAVYGLASAAGGSETITETALAGTCSMVVFQFRGSSAGASDGTTQANNGNFSSAASICTPGSGANTCTGNFTPALSGEAVISFGLSENFNGATWSAGSVCGGTGTIPANGQTSTGGNMVLGGQYFLACPVSTTTATLNLSTADRVQALTALLQP